MNRSYNIHDIILTFLKQSFNELLDFATVHSLVNYTNLVDICLAHLAAKHASNIEIIRQKWYWCCDWQRATPESHMHNNVLFAPLVVRVQAGCSAFPFYTPTKLLIRLYFNIQTVFIPKLNTFFFILDIYNKM